MSSSYTPRHPHVAEFGSNIKIALPVELKQELLDTAIDWIHNQPKSDTSKDNLMSQHQGIAIGDEDLDHITKKLKKSASYSMKFDGDKHKTTFRSVDGKLRAFDKNFPEGRDVHTHTSVYQDPNEMVPTSWRGLASKALLTFNKENDISDNISIANFLYTLQKDHSASALIILICALLYAERVGCTYMRAPIPFRKSDNMFALAISKKPTTTDEEFVICQQFLLLLLKVSNEQKSWPVEEDSESEQEVDDPDAPNVFPYKKCTGCGDRKSCGNYTSERAWFCEDCYKEENTDS